MTYTEEDLRAALLLLEQRAPSADPIDAIETAMTARRRRRVFDRPWSPRWVPPLLAATAVLIVATVTTTAVRASRSEHDGPAGAGTGRPAATVPALAATTSVTGTPIGPAASTGPVVARLVLDQTTATAGDPIYGQLLLINTTGKVITLPPNCGSWYRVGLTNAKVAFNPVRADSLCIPIVQRSPTVRLARGVQLPPGATQFPVTISTSYLACVTSPKSAPALPRCTAAHVAPALPAGTYVTKAIIDGLPTGSQVTPPIQVNLLTS